LNAIQTRSQLR